MALPSFIPAIFIGFVVSVITGCNSSHSRVGVSDFFVSMEEQLAKSGNVVKTNISTPLSIADYPLITEVCKASLPTPNYQFDGDMMRIKVVKHAYEVSGDSKVYKHEYAVCFNFYPPAEGVKQEVAYVKLLASMKSGAKKVTADVKKIGGGVEGLLETTRFNIPLTVANSTWSQVTRKDYPDETSRVQFLKMSPLEMNAVNKYDSDKYKDLLAFEIVYANISLAGSDLKFEDVQIAIVENAMQ